jgi:cytoskeletal protein CcmA (bactofilin family)
MIELRPIPGKQIESELSLFSQGSLIKGEVTFDRVARVHGRIEGKVIGLEGSVIVVGETASIHGEIHGDEIIIDGFVHGNVEGKTKVTVSEYGRLIGDVRAPKFEIRFGAHFDGKAITTTARSTTPKGNA